MGSAVYARLRQRPKRWVHLDGIPFTQLAVYLLAVSFLFSVVGFYADINPGGHQQYAVVFLSATFSGLNAAFWILFFARLANFWIVVLFLFQFTSRRVNTKLAQWVEALSLPAPLSNPVSVQLAATAILFWSSSLTSVSSSTSAARERSPIASRLSWRWLTTFRGRSFRSFVSRSVLLRSSEFLNPATRLVATLSILSNCQVETRLPTWRTCGHCLQAGILMGRLKTAVRTALMSEADTDEGILSLVMARLNPVLPQVKEAQMYATFTGLRLNRHGQLFYGMAASPPLLHWSAPTGRIDRIQEEQFPLGLLEVKDFPARQLFAESGDILLVATDGIYEVCSGRDVEFGMDALEKLLVAPAAEPLRKLASLILQAARLYGRQVDDQTLLLVRKRAR